jgi:hypothetical protein
MPARKNAGNSSCEYPFREGFVITTIAVDAILDAADSAIAVERRVLHDV